MFPGLGILGSAWWRELGCSLPTGSCVLPRMGRQGPREGAGKNPGVRCPSLVPFAAPVTQWVTSRSCARCSHLYLQLRQPHLGKSQNSHTPLSTRCGSTLMPPGGGDVAQDIGTYQVLLSLLPSFPSGCAGPSGHSTSSFPSSCSVDWQHWRPFKAPCLTDEGPGS